MAAILLAVDPGLERQVSDRVVQWLPDLEADRASLEVAELGGPFETVVLGSHLVNSPDVDLRRTLLRIVATHLGRGGRVLVEHHPLDWLETAAESWSERDGQRLGMVEVQIDPPFVSAVSVYEAGGRVVRQPFTARVLSEDELGAALEGTGLTMTRRLSPTWLEALGSTGPPSR